MMTRSTAVKIRIRDILDGEFVRSAERWEPNYLVTSWSDKISRVRILANVVAKYVSEEKNYSTITLDDGSDTITVRAFQEEKVLLENTKVGDIVDVVGRIKEYQEERYLTPESVFRVDDPNWELVRRLELLKAAKSRPVREAVKSQAPVEVEKAEVAQAAQKVAVMPDSSNIEVIEEVVEAEHLAMPIASKPSKDGKEPGKGTGDGHKGQVLRIVKDLDEGDGVKYITLLKESKLTEDALDSLLDELMQDGDVYEPKIGRFKGI